MLGVIGGSGTERLFENKEYKTVETKYGKVKIAIVKDFGKEFVFLPRHGFNHELPPHRINYHANIKALHNIGVDKIIATNAVGALKEEYKIGSILIPHTFLDFSKRIWTFFDDKPVHTDMTRPYDKELSKIVFDICKSLGYEVIWEGVYVSTAGPRFETDGEINMFRILGGDVVGMTGAPEVILSRELGIRYASISIITNYAAGLQKKVTEEEVYEVMRNMEEKIHQIIKNIVAMV